MADTNKLASVFEQVCAIFHNSGFLSGNKPKEEETEHLLIRKVFDIIWSDGGRATYNVRPSVEGHDTTKEADYAFFHSLDRYEKAHVLKDHSEQWRLAAAVGEAKRWGMSLDKELGNRTPGVQITDYLYRTGVRWGILTNGAIWRLYERERSRSGPVFFEVDLEDIVNRESLDDFKWFFLFFGRESFKPDSNGKGFVDRVLDGSREYAVEVSKNLKERVYEALPILIEGFLSFAGNKLDRWDENDVKLCHESGLIVLYRLLFILYAEDRKLLPFDQEDYRAYSLRELATDIKEKKRVYLPRRTRIWPQLCDAFRAIDCGDSELGIPAYNGGLFSPNRYERIAYTQDYSQNPLGIGDSFMSKVILRLAYEAEKYGRKQSSKVDYATLDVQHLGAIYEGLLELTPYVAPDETEEKELGKVRIYVAHEILRDGGTKSSKKNGRLVKLISKGEVYLATDKHERRVTGSYYTPKFIVDYIVEKTIGPLVERARDETAALADDLQRRISQLQASLKSRPHPNEKKKLKIDLQSVYLQLMSPYLNLKVLDPAIGSGHFLVGAADYLARSMADDETLFALVEFEGKNGEEPLTFFKRLVTEHCLYGVDINPLAVELAKLSMWLHTASRGRVLSFLDHHIRVGNSLLGAMTERDLTRAPLPASKRERNRLLKSGERWQPTLGFTETLTKRHLALFLDKFREIAVLPSDTHEDESIKERIYAELDKARAPYREVANLWLAPFYGEEYRITPEQYQTAIRALGGTVDERNALASEAWYVNAQTLANEKRFFHWELEFPDAFFESRGTGAVWKPKAERGFDAIIGNPPYVRQGGLAEDKPAFEYLWSDVFQGTSDIYVCFLGLGMSLLNENGMMGMITSNKYMRSNYGKKLREYMSTNADFQHIVDFGELPVFDEASTFPCVVVLKRGEIGETRFTQVKSLDFVEKEDLADVEQQHSIALFRESFEGENWSLAPSEEVAIMRKMEETGVPLGAWLAESNSYIRRGVVSGYNEAFVIDEATCNQLICEHKKSAEVIKPLVIGDDIRRYRINYRGRFLIFTRRGIKIDKYPAIRRYLESFKERLMPKPSLDSDFEGRKPGDYEWYEIQDSVDYYIDFEKPKIVYPEIAKKARFTIDTFAYYPLKTCFNLRLFRTSISLKSANSRS